MECLGLGCEGRGGDKVRNYRRVMEGEMEERVVVKLKDGVLRWFRQLK